MRRRLLCTWTMPLMMDCWSALLATLITIMLVLIRSSSLILEGAIWRSGLGVRNVTEQQT